MSQKTFTVTASVVFLVIAVLHTLRLFFHWEAIIGSWSVPHWLSGVAIALFGYLSYSGFKENRRRPK